jgi:hypothetical protein
MGNGKTGQDRQPWTTWSLCGAARKAGKVSASAENAATLANCAAGTDRGTICCVNSQAMAVATPACSMCCASTASGARASYASSSA